MCETKNFYCWALQFLALLGLLALCLWLALRPKDPAFHQGRGKTRQVIDFVDVNPRVWKTFRNSILNATAELKVALRTRVQYKTWGVKSKHYGLDLQGKLPIGSDGKISGKKKKVKLSHASKKWRRSNSRRLLG